MQAFQPPTHPRHFICEKAVAVGKIQVQVEDDGRSVGSWRVSCRLEPTFDVHDNIIFSSHNGKFLDAKLRHPLWREDGSIVWIAASFWFWCSGTITTRCSHAGVCPSYITGNGFPFCRLLRMRYSDQPAHKDECNC
jgi:hypothetical protein